MQSFEVRGNTLLSPERIGAVLESFKGQRSVEELRQAAAAVQELYREAGYGAVVAYLPEQNPRDGKILISVLEGKLSSITVFGNERHSAKAVRRSLPALREGATPRVRDLDLQVRLANENPARRVALTLEPGTAQGQVDARVNVTESRDSQWWLFVDNTGDDRTGRWRSTVGWRHDNVADLDHQATVQWQTSPTDLANVRVGTVTYGLPFYAQSLRLDAYAAYSSVDGGTAATALGNLAFSGRGGMLGVRLSRPLARVDEIDQRLAIALDRRAYRNDCSIVGLPSGACGAAGESVTTHPLTLEYSAQSSGTWPLGVYLSWSRNLDVGGSHAEARDFDEVRPGSRPDFSLWRLNAYMHPRLPREWSVRARLVGQVTSHALVPGEQFGLAGSRAVRGYEEREIVGDRGFLGSVELVSPPLGAADSPAAGSSQAIVQLSAFLDAGRVENHLGTECLQGRTRCSLASQGIGLSWARGGTRLKLDLARAARDGNSTRRGDLRAHVAVSHAFD